MRNNWHLACRAVLIGRFLMKTNQLGMALETNLADSPRVGAIRTRISIVLAFFAFHFYLLHFFTSGRTRATAQSNFSSALRTSIINHCPVKPNMRQALMPAERTNKQGVAAAKTPTPKIVTAVRSFSFFVHSLFILLCCSQITKKLNFSQ